MTFQFRNAVRQDTKPLIGLYSQSGCGKTYSSLLLARGYVGPNGRIAMIDTESGRGSLYADQIPGGYDVAEMEAPFTPGAYIEAIEAVESAGYDICIIDSGSHEWEGIGGVCDMAAKNEASSGKPGLHNWKRPKAEHQKFVARLLRARVPIIINLRSKFKTRQVKEKSGKTSIVKDDFTTPIQADDFIFEMTAHAEIMQNHGIRLTKCSHPDLKPCFPDGTPVALEHGAAIAEWAKGSEAKTPAHETLAAARTAASNGRAAFEKWWQRAGADERSIARTITEELEKLTAGADEQENPLSQGDAA